MAFLSISRLEEYRKHGTRLWFKPPLGSWQEVTDEYERALWLALLDARVCPMCGSRFVTYVASEEAYSYLCCDACLTYYKRERR